LINFKPQFLQKLYSCCYEARQSLTSQQCSGALLPDNADDNGGGNIDWGARMKLLTFGHVHVEEISTAFHLNYMKTELNLITNIPIMNNYLIY
jgi:hypothetical protein